MFAQVVFNIPVDKHFDYKIPIHLVQHVCAGKRVIVPFRDSFRSGYVVGVSETTSSPYTKNVTQILDEEPLVSEELMKLTRWIADTTLASHGEVLNKILPPAVKKKSIAKMLKFVELITQPVDPVFRGPCFLYRGSRYSGRFLYGFLAAFL